MVLFFNPVKQLIVISGPTGSGKTDLAIKVAQHFSTEIVSADSRQVYSGLEIGTAQPDKNQLSLVKHHMIGFLNVTENYNAGLFETNALKVIEEIFSKNDIAILCGGTGLYIDAVLTGMDNLPNADPEIRLKLEQQYLEKGIIFLQEEIKSKDADYASSADLNNPQRLMRALEVCFATGLPYSSFLTGNKSKRSFNYSYFALSPDRTVLYNQINQRTEKMFATGLLEEAEKMLPFRNTNALQTVGYKEIFKYFDGVFSLDDAIEKVKQHTRNYAKRQLTWLRRNDAVTFVNPDNAYESIINYK